MRERGNRLLELDVLRGFAALWVMLFHYFSKYNDLFRLPQDPGPITTFPDGMIGVYLFFMISGFVIFMTIQRSKSGLDFVVSRFSRLFPTYWVAIVLTGTIGFLAPLPGQTIGPLQLVVNLTMLQSFLLVPGIDGVYWTLGIELGFYFIMLTAFLLGWLKRTEWCAWAWLGFVVLVHAATAASIWVPWRLSQLLILDYAQWFILGIVFYRARESGYSCGRVMLIVACLVIEASIESVIMAAVMGAFVLVFYLCLSGRCTSLLLAPLLWLGSISYPLYLTHQMIGYRIIRSLSDDGWPPIAANCAVILVALCLAWAISKSVERPGQRVIRDGYRRWRVSSAGPRSAGHTPVRS